MTTQKNTMEDENNCPAEGLLKSLSGKWKAHIFRIATAGPVRFNELLRKLEGSNKQSLSAALKEMEEHGLLNKRTVTQKPLHIEYDLTDKGRSLIPVFQELEKII